MRYRVSPHRKDFDIRVKGLLKSSYLASNRRGIPSELRDLVFQAAILHTSAAIEEYVKFLFEGWAYIVRLRTGTGANVPARTLAVLAKFHLQKHFENYSATNDEKALLKRLELEGPLWAAMAGNTVMPLSFNGSVVYAERKFPSTKNISVLFSRIGIDDIFGKISAHIRADAEFRLEGFNSIRNALAHSQPPQITYLDVKRNLLEMMEIIGAVDRIVHRPLSRLLGQSIW